MLKKQIAEIKKKIIEQSFLIEDMIELSFQGLIEKKDDKLKKVFLHEKKVNEIEIMLEDEGTSLIALYQPEAKELRTILMLLKMNGDLERMGDLAFNNAKSALYLISRPLLNQVISIGNMAKETKKMLRKSVQSFLNEDIMLSQEVCRNDRIVDALNSQIFKSLLKEVVPHSFVLESAFHINKYAKNLERIADLCTNIAEYTAFIKDGKIIKHRYQIP